MAEVITTLKMVRRFVLQKKRVNSRKKIGGDILLRIQFLDLRANYEVASLLPLTHLYMPCLLSLPLRFLSSLVVAPNRQLVQSHQECLHLPLYPLL